MSHCHQSLPTLSILLSELSTTTRCWASTRAPSGSSCHPPPSRAPSANTKRQLYDCKRLGNNHLTTDNSLACELIGGHDSKKVKPLYNIRRKTQNRLTKNVMLFVDSGLISIHPINYLLASCVNSELSYSWVMTRYMYSPLNSDSVNSEILLIQTGDYGPY